MRLSLLHFSQFVILILRTKSLNLNKLEDILEMKSKRFQRDP